MSCRCIVTSPAQLVDEYAEQPSKIVLNPSNQTKWCYLAPKLTATLTLVFATLLSPLAYTQTEIETETAYQTGAANESATATQTETGKETANTIDAANGATAARNGTISDMLIVLDSDGRSHTVQHTVATGGAALELLLPGSVIPQEVMFFGPERDRFAAVYKNNPSVLMLSSGSAFARYQHQYGTEVQQVLPGQFILTTPSVPANINLNELSLSQSSISWVFPNEFELVSYTVTDYNTGRWVSANNTLTFYNTGTNSVELSINYKKNAGTLTQEISTCNNISTPTDACADDLDEDGIPDYRDICLSNLGQLTGTFGCVTDQGMVLHTIEFETGRTYLDVAARELLDKVAHAILKSENTFFEIGSHTDNAGAAQSNQQLSQKRAGAVRHYLMLKGVSPNAIRATGYGEKYPIRDNSSADGRRANRRIELVIIK